jgi:hypothetical protein
LGGSRYDVSLCKKSSRDPNTTNKKLGVVVCDYRPSYMGCVNRRSVVQARLVTNTTRLFEKQLKQTGLEAWQRACLASSKPWVQYPVPQKKKDEKNNFGLVRSLPNLLLNLSKVLLSKSVRGF